MSEFMLYAAAYWIMCVLLFGLVQKPLFLLLNRNAAGNGLRMADVAASYRHGFRTDAIIASYLTALPMIIGGVMAMMPGVSPRIPLTVYNALIALPVALIFLSDAVLYGFWFAKIDVSVLAYLRNPKAAFASVSARYVVTAAVVALLLALLIFACTQTVTEVYVAHRMAYSLRWWGYPLILLIIAIGAGVLFAVIRGLGIRPNTPSVAYFSPLPFLNHLALNPVYSFIYSLGTRDEFSGRFRSMTDEECAAELADAFPTSGASTRRLLRTKRPNILLVVWESLGAEMTGCVGNRPDITPNLDAMAREGVLFSRVSAGSFRTDRGVACLFSGLPGQPTTSIVRYTRKLPALPALPRRLTEIGYDTTAIYGGDISFMHINDYYLACGYSQLLSQSNFPPGLDKNKWGVHDGPAMQFCADRIEEMAQSGRPWMTTLLTLSSHEPFEVPYHRLSDRIANSFAYTDASLGALKERLRKMPGWDDLLVIVVADHGLNLTNNPDSRRDYCHIPIVMWGGAVEGPQVIDTPMSQTDLAATILGQMGLDHSDFPFSRDVTADTYTRPFGFHTYNNGFLVDTPEGYTDYDNVAEAAVSGAHPGRERLGKAILQRLYAYLSKL